MKNIILTIVLLLPLLIISCSKNSNPVSDESKNPPVNHPHSSSSFAGVEIQFADTCSYNFITTFLSTLDSIVVLDKSLGSTFYLYADSGDNNYWQNYFTNDPTIKSMYSYNSSDSLILVITSTGQKLQDEEKQRFSEIKNLRIKKIVESPKLVYIDVPENTETTWEPKLERYSFILHAYLVYVWTES